MVGRWSDDVLAVIIETDPAAAAVPAAILTEELAAGYPADAREDRTGPVLQIRSSIVGRERRANAAEFYPQLGQCVAALTA
jgi:hypothetical protein